ncbi:YhbY family RNA-binding protein, partial [Pseudomonas syringae group genomosp. 7]|uniref:YhbY family RNA-binding protein n=1 Tax=Pseudomonas syringae group genomosp. 7 TaxID=251699 RepID=UPI00376FBA78
MGHLLIPVLIVADIGLTEGVLAELERAVSDHELLKIKLNILGRGRRLGALAAV